MTVPSRVAPTAEVGWARRFYGSTVGRKVVMAVTGMVLVGYVAVHMAGNLLMFRGEAAMNGYAATLQGNLPLLWTVRVVVFLSLVFHIHSAVTLSRQSWAARRHRYARHTLRSATPSARLMRTGGALLAVFVVFHILHFTTGNLLPSLFVKGEAYQNVVRSFSIGWVAVFYVVAMAGLALHLHHGIWSAFQSLGLNHPNLEAGRRRLAWLLAVLIPIGFVSVPLAIVFGMVR